MAHKQPDNKPADPRQTMKADELPAGYATTVRETSGDEEAEQPFRKTVVVRREPVPETFVEKKPPAEESGATRPGSAATGGTTWNGSAEGAIRYRCFSRPPMGLLVAFDDGSTDTGETWRIRRPTFVIGRESGDAVIAHDVNMSAEHAQICRREKEGGWTWELIDCGSTNGTFLRVARAILRSGKELLIGRRRYLFRDPGVRGDVAEASRRRKPAGSYPEAHASGSPGEAHASGSPGEAHASGSPGEAHASGSPGEAGGAGDAIRTTHKDRGGPSDVAGHMLPRLFERTPSGEKPGFQLRSARTWIGSDPSECDYTVGGDPFVDPRHALLYRDKRGRWMIEDAGSLNGLWLRVNRVPLDSDTEFQLGGQRFLFRIL